MFFQPLQSNGNKHKRCFMQFEAQKCINRVFCRTTSKTINFETPTSIFQTDKQKTQLLTNWKCKKNIISATSEWLVCVQLNGFVLFVVFEVIGVEVMRLSHVHLD